MPESNYLLTLSCPNQRGIVAALTTELFANGGDIRTSNQFEDTETNQFFLRITFDLADEGSATALQSGMDLIRARFGRQLSIVPRKALQKVLLLVSKLDHCLVDLLYRWRSGELPMNIVGVVSNHPRNTFTNIDLVGVPFYYLPVNNDNRAAQEAQIKGLVNETGAALVVLARYMQILSPDLATFLTGRCINIHHSFLPGFKGARPYHQAHARGVKLIGATAHYVTANLDEGPIIEQDVERISHNDSPADFIRKGRDIERRVLARAVAAHLDGRSFANGATTVVFRD
jgi:formyltetrahydrofolate deformylase